MLHKCKELRESEVWENCTRKSKEMLDKFCAEEPGTKGDLRIVLSVYNCKGDEGII